MSEHVIPIRMYVCPRCGCAASEPDIDTHELLGQRNALLAALETMLHKAVNTAEVLGERGVIDGGDGPLAGFVTSNRVKMLEAELEGYCNQARAAIAKARKETT